MCLPIRIFDGRCVDIAQHHLAIYLGAVPRQGSIEVYHQVHHRGGPWRRRCRRWIVDLDRMCQGRQRNDEDDEQCTNMTSINGVMLMSVKDPAAALGFIAQSGARTEHGMSSRNSRVGHLQSPPGHVCRSRPSQAAAHRRRVAGCRSSALSWERRSAFHWHPRTPPTVETPCSSIRLAIKG